MTTVYVLRKGAKAKKEGKRIAIEVKGEIVQSVPVRDVQSFVLAEGTHISTPLLELFIDEDIPVYFIDFYGKIKAQISGSNTSWFRSKAQMDKFTDQENKLGLIRWLLGEKLENQRKLLKYYARQKRDFEIGQMASDIGSMIRDLDKTEDVEMLRGIEGMAAKKYFSAYSLILDNSRWKWKGRSRRPALDPANALLNYAYAFLEREVRTAITGVGLDYRFGFFHSNNGRKDSLVFDLMELFRQPVIDRMVLSTINRKRLSPEEFESDNVLGWRVGADVKRTWIAIYEEYMNKSYQEFDEMTPREWISLRVRDFSLMIFRNEVEAA